MRPTDPSASKPPSLRPLAAWLPLLAILLLLPALVPGFPRAARADEPVVSPPVPVDRTMDDVSPALASETATDATETGEPASDSVDAGTSGESNPDAGALQDQAALEEIRRHLAALHRDDLHLSTDGRTLAWKVRSVEKPSVLAPILKNVLGETVVGVNGVDGFNTILVELSKPDPLVVDQILEFISQVDRPEKQVFIRVLVAEFTREKEKDWGNHIRLLQDGIKDLTDVSMSMGLNHSPYSTVEEESLRTGWKMFVISGRRIREFLYAQQTNNNFQILSNPQIVATHGKQAQIMVGEVVSVRKSATVANGVAQVSYEDKSIGMSLLVTPFIHSDGLVSLDIMQKVTSLEKYDADLNIADTNDRQITTTANVAVGKTVVLGGIMQKRRLRNKSGVPGLSRIPLVGKIFDRSDQNESEVELMVFLTPEIVESGAQQEQLVERAVNALDLGNENRKVLERIVPRPSPEIRATAASAAACLETHLESHASATIASGPNPGSAAGSPDRTEGLAFGTASGPEVLSSGPEAGPATPTPAMGEMGPRPSEGAPPGGSSQIGSASPTSDIMSRFAEVLAQTRDRRKTLSQAR